MAEPISIVHKPTPASILRIDTAGALLRVEYVAIVDDDAPLAPRLRALAAELERQASAIEPADPMDGPEEQG